MIANPKRILPESVGAFFLQFGLAKYPFLLAGESVPFNAREIVTMVILALIAALLLENIVYRYKLLTSRSKRSDKGK